MGQYRAIMFCTLARYWTSSGPQINQYKANICRYVTSTGPICLAQYWASTGLTVAPIRCHYDAIIYVMKPVQGHYGCPIGTVLAQFFHQYSAITNHYKTSTDPFLALYWFYNGSPHVIIIVNKKDLIMITMSLLMNNGLEIHYNLICWHCWASQAAHPSL